MASVKTIFLLHQSLLVFIFQQNEFSDQFDIQYTFQSNTIIYIMNIFQNTDSPYVSVLIYQPQVNIFHKLSMIQ
jgi:hypothetical protein